MRDCCSTPLAQLCGPWNHGWPDPVFSRRVGDVVTDVECVTWVHLSLSHSIIWGWGGRRWQRVGVMNWAQCTLPQAIMAWDLLGFASSMPFCGLCLHTHCS
jgi:hypothetical protein